MSSAQEKNGANNGGNAVGKLPTKELSQKRAQRYSTRRILWGVGSVLAILSLIMIVVISRQSGKQLQEVTRAVTHTREVLEKLGNIAVQLSEVESAARSFAISGKQSHLSSFYTAAEAVPPQVDELKLLLQDDPRQLQSITEIEPVITKHLKVMKDMVGLGDKNLFRGFGQRNLTGEGNDLMEQIQATFSTVENEQHSLLDQEQTTEAAKVNRVAMISVAGSMLASVFILACGACALRAMHGRRKAEE